MSIEQQIAAAGDAIAAAIADEPIRIVPQVVEPAPETKPAEPAPAAEAPATPAAPAAPATPEATKPAEPAPTPEAPAAPKTPEELYIEALNAGRPETPALDDAAKAALKARGIEDVDAFLNEHATITEQLNQYRTKAEQYDAVDKALKELPVEIAQSIQDYRDGKDYTQALMPLSKGITLSKEAKDIDPFKLVDHYYPGRFTEEQKAEIADGTNDALKAAHDQFVELASGKHDGMRAQRIAQMTERQASAKAQQEADARAIAANIAYMKKDPALSALLTPDLQRDFEDGTLIQKTFYNADGTYKEAGLALIAKGLNHDAVVSRMMKGAAAKAKVEGELAARERLPEKPPTAPGEIKQPIPKPSDDGRSEQQRYADEALAKALAG